MALTVLLLLALDAVFLVSLVLLVIAAFRVRVFYGFAVLLLPFSGLIFAIRYWKDVGGKFLLNVGSFVAMVAVIGSSPQLMTLTKHRFPGTTLVANALGTADAPLPGQPSGRGGFPAAPHEVHDLAANEAAAAPAPAADPFAARRAAYVRHGAALAAEYQRLNAERATLKPASPDVAVFNVKAAHYQSDVQALQTEKTQLDALDHPTGAISAAKWASHPQMGVVGGVPRVENGPDAEANAALTRLRTMVEQGDYAAFAVLLKKSLADYRQTPVYPQIVAYGRQVMQRTPPANLPAAIQQQGVVARAEMKATVAQVQAIVNQVPPVVSKPRGAGSQTCLYHPGATKPDFNTADVVSGREGYPGAEFLQWEGRPNVFYRAADCEFNAQTKMFYTARDVPKKKLTDAENQEVVRLYRTIGRDEAIIDALPQRLADAKSTSADLVALNTQLAGNASDDGTRGR